MNVLLGRQETDLSYFMLVGLSLIFIAPPGSRADGVDYSMALLWSSKDSTSRLGTLGLLYGDPDVFLQQLQVTQTVNASYNGMQYTLHDFTSSFDSVEVDYDKSNVIWSDQAYKSIDILTFSAGDTSGTFYYQNVPPVSSQVTGLSFDWVSKLVYLSDAGFQRIAVHDASVYLPIWWRPVVDTNLTLPQDIVVYPNQSYLFWIDLDISPKIERFNLVNEIREVLVSNDTILSPTKLAIDFKSDRLYWLDSNMATIGSCNLDGSNISLWQLDLFSQISAFTFYRQYLFLGDRTRSLIHAFNASGNQVLSNFQLFSSQQGIIDFATYDPSKQISIQSPCTVSKGGCSHFCIKINASARKCQCAMGFFLDSDGRSCVTRPFQDKFLLVTDTRQQQLFQVDIGTGEIRAVTAVEAFLPTAADYDYVSKNVYWFDSNNNGTIRQTSLTNGVTRIFVNSVAAEITNLAVDTVGRNLYYTCYFASTIGVISLSTGDSRTILTEPGSRPRVLGLDIENRSLYWADCAARSIEKAQMSNPDVHQAIVSQLGFCVSALAIDALNGVIYWGDRGGNIESSKLDGSARRLLYTKSSTNYTGMTTDDNYVYIADSSIRQLLKLDKTTNKISSLTGNLFVKPYALILYNSSVPKKTSTYSSTTSTSTFTNSTAELLVTPVSKGGPSTTTIIVASVVCVAVVLIAVIVVVGVVVAKWLKRRKTPAVIHAPDPYDGIIPSPYESPEYTNRASGDYTELDGFQNHDYDLEIDGEIKTSDMRKDEEFKGTRDSNRQSAVDNDYIRAKN